ncbi:SpoU rRNA Methylase family domain-containing protein [Chloropicon primus]|uniref:tRNA/rRNA methyltransferase SpoU type domain-containing protein n=2 Tax=Chloropicon primus TaxID=1764295 RepID=A0A5B8MP70_9CHLO|nr:hypothetical protein A3770_07p46290 [Chloropicon primus]UPR01329.1 SpoU rRNA Methylase family domain-containing protein [Chloropicon primus]|eukprot:QDZ22111.1 hypothetical protein A3770_07p46290 [Chloropicon primus]
MAMASSLLGFCLALYAPWRWRRRKLWREEGCVTPADYSVPPCDIVVVLERCTDPRNFESVRKVVQAFELELWSVDAVSYKKKSGRNPFGAELMGDGTDGMVQIEADKNFSTPQSFIEEVEREGMALWATELSQEACSLSASLRRRVETNDRRKIALVFGREVDGVSQKLLKAAQERVYLPLHGFSDSLNVSTSVALILDCILCNT